MYYTRKMLKISNLYSKWIANIMCRNLISYKSLKNSKLCCTPLNCTNKNNSYCQVTDITITKF